jgi:hypothetical protein
LNIASFCSTSSWNRPVLAHHRLQMNLAFVHLVFVQYLSLICPVFVPNLSFYLSQVVPICPICPVPTLVDRTNWQPYLRWWANGPDFRDFNNNYSPKRSSPSEALGEHGYPRDRATRNSARKVSARKSVIFGPKKCDFRPEKVWLSV